MNSSPDAVAGLNDLPVRTVNGATTYLRDVAYVRDGFTTQTNIVRQDGNRGVLLSVFMLQEGEDRIVAERLRAVLKRAPA